MDHIGYTSGPIIATKNHRVPGPPGPTAFWKGNLFISGPLNAESKIHRMHLLLLKHWYWRCLHKAQSTEAWWWSTLRWGNRNSWIQFLVWLGTWARFWKANPFRKNSPTGNIVNPNQWISQRGEPVAVCQSIVAESGDLPKYGCWRCGKLVSFTCPCDRQRASVYRYQTKSTEGGCWLCWPHDACRTGGGAVAFSGNAVTCAAEKIFEILSNNNPKCQLPIPSKKRIVLQGKFHFQSSIFRGYVNFQGGYSRFLQPTFEMQVGNLTLDQAAYSIMAQAGGWWSQEVHLDHSNWTV